MKKKLLPFDKAYAPFHSARATRDFRELDQMLNKILRRFGFRRVLGRLKDIAGEQCLIAMGKRENFANYRDAADVLDDSEKRLDKLVRLAELESRA